MKLVLGNWHLDTKIWLFNAINTSDEIDPLTGLVELSSLKYSLFPNESYYFLSKYAPISIQNIYIDKTIINKAKELD